jgi:phosphate transport system substrate-binding protein
MTMAPQKLIQIITTFASHAVGNRLKIKNRMQIFLRKFIFSTLSLAGLILIIVSCKGGKQAMQDETPTRGNIRIIADESFKPIIDAEVFAFTSIYQNAHVRVAYKPEVDVINDFMNDSTKTIVTSKRLSEDQIQFLRDSLIVARTTTFAYDALALVINRNNKDTLMNFNDVRDIFKGKITKWNELDPKASASEIRVIFDNTKSGNIRYFKELFEIEGQLQSNFFAVNSNTEVVDFVSRNRDALGIVSVNWISDKDDSANVSLLSKIKTVAVSQQLINDGYYYRPEQGWIYDRSYPFVREVFFISRESFLGLGSGLIQYSTGEQGQRIVLKMGLVPATMPIRLVQIRE